MHRVKLLKGGTIMTLLDCPKRAPPERPMGPACSEVDGDDSDQPVTAKHGRAKTLTATSGTRPGMSDSIPERPANSKAKSKAKPNSSQPPPADGPRLIAVSDYEYSYTDTSANMECG
jgi:hypothetical protein